ncbi:MAG TPA: MBL fold metallo-hydrolase [Kofleriaceae bacterium]|jgi:7,8-dihydropterin-6-yl-methyl-4-(beta-D-ribofuranosyl)aminobenzene 5'-phosphate synthase|nr:MBL fold metallo-hydrolase [Kofleriaceae bacterium]
MATSPSSATASALLDELRVLVIVDNETDTLSSIDEGVPQTPEIVHLATRVPTTRVHDGHDCKVVFDQLCCAGHGLSLLLTGKRGDEEHTILFDVGPYADLWLDNAKRLGVDLSKIEAVFLSHWHSDHSAGLPPVVAAIASARKARSAVPIVMDVHPDRPDQRGLLFPSGTMMLLPDEPSLAEIQAAGGVVETHAEAHTLCDGFFFASGGIDRVTDYETGLASHHSFRGGKAEPDPLILDERFLAAQVRGRGVTVLSACSHAGIVNACLAARHAYNNAPMDVVLGGFHLSGKAMEPRIAATVRDLKERIEPRVVAPGHCTGWRAKAALAAAFAPGHYGPSVVGSLYVMK